MNKMNVDLLQSVYWTSKNHWKSSQYPWRPPFSVSLLHTHTRAHTQSGVHASLHRLSMCNLLSRPLNCGSNLNKVSHDFFHQQLKHVPPFPFKFIKIEWRYCRDVTRLDHLTFCAVSTFTSPLEAAWKMPATCWDFISLRDCKANTKTLSPDLLFNLSETFQPEHKDKEADGAPSDFFLPL